jgi:hypothetical protein
MPAKSVTIKKEGPIPPITDPVAKEGDYKSIAAQYAKAKALKEKEDASAALKKFGRVREGMGQSALGKDEKAPRTATEQINKAKAGIFKKTWTSSLGFFFWLL